MACYVQGCADGQEVRAGKEVVMVAMFHGWPGRPMRAVFLNYLFDCLPAGCWRSGAQDESLPLG